MAAQPTLSHEHAEPPRPGSHNPGFCGLPRALQGCPAASVAAALWAWPWLSLSWATARRSAGLPLRARRA